MLAKVLSAAVVGLAAVPIEIEVAIASQGLLSITIIGLPDKAVEETKERVCTAIRNSRADFADSERISPTHIAEALQYRPKTTLRMV